MGKRGRREILKEKKDNLVKEFKNKMTDAIQKGKLTKMQLGKIKKGLGVAWEIRCKIKQFKKELKKLEKDPETFTFEKKVLQDKIEKLQEIFSCIKTQDTDRMKEIAKEYEKLYPKDFED